MRAASGVVVGSTEASFTRRVYNRTMKAVMVSDAHLEGLQDPRQAAFVSWLGGLDCDVLYLLGDVFHHWWGYDGVVLTDYVPVCAALLEVAGRGIRVVFVPGNHDFAAGAFFERVLGARVRGALACELGGRRFYVAHGDEADDSLGYRVTRWALRGGAFAVLMRALGPARGYALLRWLAGASRQHVGSATRLGAAQRRWAEARWAEGATCVVLGHSHLLGRLEQGGHVLVHLGDWIEHRSWLEVVDGHPRLLRLDAEGQVVEVTALPRPSSAPVVP